MLRLPYATARGPNLTVGAGLREAFQPARLGRLEAGGAVDGGGGAGEGEVGHLARAVGGLVADHDLLAAEPARETPARTRAAGLVPGAVNFADVAERLNAAVVNIDAASRAGRETRIESS